MGNSTSFDAVSNSDMLMTLSVRRRKLQDQINALSNSTLSDLQSQLDSVNKTIDALTSVNQGKAAIVIQPTVANNAQPSLIDKITSFFS